MMKYLDIFWQTLNSVATKTFDIFNFGYSSYHNWYSALIFPFANIMQYTLGVILGAIAGIFAAIAAAIYDCIAPTSTINSEELIPLLVPAVQENIEGFEDDLADQEGLADNPADQDDPKEMRKHLIRQAMASEKKAAYETSLKAFVSNIKETASELKTSYAESQQWDTRASLARQFSEAKTVAQSATMTKTRSIKKTEHQNETSIWGSKPKAHKDVFQCCRCERESDRWDKKTICQSGLRDQWGHSIECDFKIMPDRMWVTVKVEDQQARNDAINKMDSLRSTIENLPPISKEFKRHQALCAIGNKVVSLDETKLDEYKKTLIIAERNHPSPAFRSVDYLPKSQYSSLFVYNRLLMQLVNQKAPQFSKLTFELINEISSYIVQPLQSFSLFKNPSQVHEEFELLDEAVSELYMGPH